MDEYISRENMQGQIVKAAEKCQIKLFDESVNVILQIIQNMPVADVQPVKKSKWCPPLMGQGKCDTYCERCHGKIMRNSTGIFEETPYCPHCGARMVKLEQ